MDYRVWPSRHRPALTVENGASPPHGAPPPVSPKHPLVCCLFFALSSLPLSHATTPPDTTHGLLATSSFSFFLSLLSSPFLSFFLSFSSFFSSSLALPFSLSLLFSDYTAVVLHWVLYINLFSSFFFFFDKCNLFSFYSFTVLLISLFQTFKNHSIDYITWLSITWLI